MKKPEFIINNDRKKLLLAKLTPITDWTMVNKGTEIFHKNTNEITMVDIVQDINTEDGFIEYKNSKGNVYTYGLSGWYIYDNDIACDIIKDTSPKFYKYCGKTFACNNIEELFTLIQETTNLVNSYEESFSDEELLNVEIVDFLDEDEVILR